MSSCLRGIPVFRFGIPFGMIFVFDTSKDAGVTRGPGQETVFGVDLRNTSLLFIGYFPVVKTTQAAPSEMFTEMFTAQQLEVSGLFMASAVGECTTCRS